MGRWRKPDKKTAIEDRKPSHRNLDRGQFVVPNLLKGWGHHHVPSLQGFHVISIDV